MRKRAVVLVVIAAMFAVFVPRADAFVILGRSDFSGLFRDIEVCTDGIKFDVGTYQDASLTEDPTQFPLGFIPSAPGSEYLVIVDGAAPGGTNPANGGPQPPGTVLGETLEVAPIANNDPYLIASNLGELPNFSVWLSTYERMWTSDLPVGTALYVYLGAPPPPEGEPIEAEIITVADCTIVEVDPCTLPGAILGTNGPDELVGTPGDDVICGFGGADEIEGLGGNDLIFAGKGADEVDGGPGDDTIYAGKGKDEVEGGPGDDTIHAGKGADEVEGGDGNDTIYGEKGKDELEGGDGDDMIDGGKGRDEIDGGDGDDTLIGGPGNDEIDGGSGSNTIIQ